MAALAHGQTITRILLVNAVMLTGVFLLLAITPAPVTFPEDPWEAALLLKGAAILLAANLFAAYAGSTTAPTRKRAARPAVDTDRATELRALEHYHVAGPEGVLGVVDVVLGDRRGAPTGLLVSDSWFGRRPFFVSLSEVAGVDADARMIVLRGRPPDDAGL